ncbi:MAG TPA: tetratricopeptide repeat protein, partial [bacterium]|nr:tetratricopeptide repeat protein [bacterium]
MNTYTFRITALAVFAFACLMGSAVRAGTPASQPKLSAKERQKLDQVKKEIQEFPRASNDIAESMFEQGQMLDERGLLDDALVQYKHAAALKPAFADMIHYNMAMIYYKQGLIEQAADELGEVLALNPSYAYAHYRLGLIALELNDLQNAVNELESVLKINPDLSEAYYYLGLAHEKDGGSAEKAVGYYASYLDAAPAGENAAAARKSIAKLSGKTGIPPASREEIVKEDEASDRSRIGTVKEEEIPDNALVEDEIKADELRDRPVAAALPAADAGDDEAAVAARNIAAAEDKAAAAPEEPADTEGTAPQPGKDDILKTYTVRENETLWIIAGLPEVYDNDSLWTYIYEANKDLLSKNKKPKAGMVLKIPRLDPAVLAKKPVAPAPAKKPSNKKQRRQQQANQQPVADEAPLHVAPKELPAQHTIIEGETLWIIAGYPAYYNDDTMWPAIFEANKETLNGKKLNLPAGTVITIPKLSPAQAAAAAKPKTTSTAQTGLNGAKKVTQGTQAPAAPQQSGSAQTPHNPVSMLSAAVPNPTNIIGAFSSAVSFWADSVGATVSPPQLPAAAPRSKRPPEPAKKTVPPAAAATPAIAAPAQQEKPAALTAAVTPAAAPVEVKAGITQNKPVTVPAAAPAPQLGTPAVAEKKDAPAGSSLAAAKETQTKEEPKAKKKRPKKRSK